MQTAFAKLYLSWDQVQRRELVDGYVRRILVNEHNSPVAPCRSSAARWSPTTCPTTHAPDRHDTGESAALWEFVQTLPRKQRAVIVLRYYEDLSEAETADVLGISVGTVKSQASRALAAMRSRVHDHPDSRPTGGGTMSNHDEDRLSRGLHDRADGLHGAPLDLEDVQAQRPRHPARRRRAGRPGGGRRGRGRVPVGTQR